MNRTDAVMKGCIVADKNCSLAKRCPDCLKEIQTWIAKDGHKTTLERAKDLENKKKETK